MKSKKLTLPNGSSRFGAQMGRPNSGNLATTAKLRLCKLPFCDGCYDRWGAYWGAPANVWIAWNEEVQAFARANSRAEAKTKFAAVFQTPNFYR